MEQNQSTGDNPRAWARPDREGDIWHEYWEPDDGPQNPQGRLLTDLAPPQADAERARRRRIGRRIAVAYLVVAPIALVIQVLLHRPAFSAALSGIVCVIGLIRMRAYGEKSRGFTIALAAYIAVWAGVAVVRVLQHHVVI